VLIDGVEVNSLSAGEFDFASLLAADIERIEVIRGPQSGVYGANALAGVVNIITKKGEGPARLASPPARRWAICG
jgi:vitamin B12 transporter